MRLAPAFLIAFWISFYLRFGFAKLIDSVVAIAGAGASTLQEIFGEEKIAKQVLNAAKRQNKKRGSSDVNEGSSIPKKKAKASSGDNRQSTDLETSLALPEECLDEEELSKCVLHTNRAPVVLAFAVQLLKYTMSEQPLSSRLSLAQAMVSANSRSKAVSLGLESGKSAEEEGWGRGQPMVRVMGRDICTMKRWGYEWKEMGETKQTETQSSDATIQQEEEQNVKPALWGLDLEALKKSSGPAKPGTGVGLSDDLPIHTPQSARAYLLKSFDTLPNPDSNASPKKKAPSATARQEEKEQNLGKLLGALDLLYQSWVTILDPTELDRRAWNWYIRVRPKVADGVAGWGGKGSVRLVDILALRRTP